MRPSRIRLLAPKDAGDMTARVYLIGLRGGIVKVGQSYHVRARIRKHAADAGDAFLWSHVFAGYGSKSGRTIERLAIEALQKVGKRLGRTEKFSGLSREQAIACVRTCIAEHEARASVWAWDRVAHILGLAEHEAFRYRCPFSWLSQRPEHPAPEPAAAAGA